MCVIYIKINKNATTTTKKKKHRNLSPISMDIYMLRLEKEGIQI